MDRAALDKLTKGDLIELVLALVERHAAEMAALRQRIADLERQVGLNSGNSGKPPSSDGLKKPPRTDNLRQPSGKPSGGQPGHPGKTLRRTETPDATVDHYPQACTTCGTALTAAMATDHVARQVFDLPEPRPLIVAEHRAHACRCAAYGRQTRAGFPAARAQALRREGMAKVTVIRAQAAALEGEARQAVEHRAASVMASFQARAARLDDVADSIVLPRAKRQMPKASGEGKADG